MNYKKIKQPYLRVQGKYFAQYLIIWKIFSKEYNKGKDSKDKLKAPHKECYFELIHLVKKKFILFPFEVDSEQWICIWTNRRKLSEIMDRHPHTIHKYLKRLEIAGIIKRIFHGTKHDFEILVNPEFLLIYDISDISYTPASKYLKQPLSIASGLLRAKRTDNITSTSSSSSNIIMADNKSAQDVNNENSIRNINRNTTKHDKELSRKDIVIRNYSKRFYKYLKSQLFANHNLYKAEEERVLVYIVENYFNKIFSDSEAENLLKSLKWRVDAAKRFVERNEFNFSNIFPRNYLDHNNRKGFKATEEWYLNNLKYEANKKRKNVANADRLKQKSFFKKLLDYYQSSPTLETFRKCEELLKNHYPFMINEFHKTFKIQSNE